MTGFVVQGHIYELYHKCNFLYIYIYIYYTIYETYAYIMYTCIQVLDCLCDAKCHWYVLFFSLDGFEDVLFFSLVGRNGGQFPLALWRPWHASIKCQLSLNEKQSTHIEVQNKRRGLNPAQHICYFIPIIPENLHRYILQSGDRRLGPRVCC